MGARGPAPKPTALKILQGNPGHQKLNKHEPKPRPGLPKCPMWLTPTAKTEWRRIVKELEYAGMLTRVDMAALAGYCTLYSTLVECERTLQVEGLTFKTASGYMAQRPEVSIRQKTLMALKGYAAEFGLTPSSRSRIQVPESEPGSNDLLD